jgi:hypothetical protein
MKNGLYVFHMHMLDGVRGRDSGILVLRDGSILGIGPCFWSTGSYTYGNGTWKGDLRTNQQTPLSDPIAHSQPGSQEVASGFSGNFAGDETEIAGTTLVGTRSLSFRARLRRLADNGLIARSPLIPESTLYLSRGRD